jgi:hypothetical protein
MFDDESEKTPECLKIAAKMIGVEVDELETKHKYLFNKLLNIRHYLQKVKPYGELASTQVVASVVAGYFADLYLNDKIAELEDKTSNLDKFGRIINNGK